VNVYLGTGSTAALANANASVITSNNAFSFLLLAGTIETWSFGPNTFFTGITQSGSALITITPGDGV
jgi:hypothetical protein